jgi:hypothetical protein
VLAGTFDRVAQCECPYRPVAFEGQVLVTRDAQDRVFLLRVDEGSPAPVPFCALEDTEGPQQVCAFLALFDACSVCSDVLMLAHL